MLFAFSLIHHPQPLAEFLKLPPDVWVTLVPKAVGSPESLGAENHHPAVMPFSPVSLVCLLFWTQLGPFPYPRTPPPMHTPVGGHMHMDTNTDALCPGTAGETKSKGGMSFSRFDLERRVGWWVT